MTRELLSVTDAELAILEVLWDQDSAVISEITARIYGKPTTSRYSTVQKLLERLEAKGCVARNRNGFAHRFSPTIGRDELIGHRLQEVAEKLCEGSLAPLLLHLVEATKLSSQERKRLLKLIDSSPTSRRDIK